MFLLVLSYLPGVLSGAINSFNNGTINIQTQFKKEIFAKVKCECCRETICELLKNPPELKPRMQVEKIRTI